MGRRSTLSDKLYHAAGVVRANDIDALYLSLISHWKNPTDLVIGGTEPDTLYNDPSHWSAAQEPARRFAIKDLLSYLPHDILTKVDRASMNVSLEARVPLLDHRVVEFCLGLSEHMLKRSGESKWLLKRLAQRYVPLALIDRPKQGFGVPLGDWLRGPLRDWAGDLLNRDRLDREGYLRSAPIVQALDRHVRGDGDWSAYLWDVLMFQSWLENRGREG
jgi:asparagine synthase (glutamine-hydrolysing)